MCMFVTNCDIIPRFDQKLPGDCWVVRWEFFYVKLASNKYSKLPMSKLNWVE